MPHAARPDDFGGDAVAGYQLRDITYSVFAWRRGALASALGLYRWIRAGRGKTLNDR